MALANDATEPTERSKPSTVSDIVMPIAMMVTIEMERRMFIRLDVWMKDGLDTAKIPIRMIIVNIVPYL